MILEKEEITPAGHDFKLQLFKDTEFQPEEGALRVFGS
jgi:hypothetical protein